MPANRNKKELLISSWPRPIAQYIPRWIPYRLLCLGQYVAGVLFMPFMVCLLLWHQYFGSTDMWGVRRDRVKETESARNWREYNAEHTYWKPAALSLSGKIRFELLLGRLKWWTWKKTPPLQSSNHLQSPLGRMPEEVRQLIYAHLFVGTRFHIQESYKRFGYVECLCNNPSTCNQVLKCLGPHMDKTPRYGEPHPFCTATRLILSSYDHLELKPTSVAGNNTYTPHMELLGLAKTCQLLSGGYLDALYTTPKFSFTSLCQFDIFSTTVPAHMLNRITSLEFHTELEFFSRRMDTGWEGVGTSQWKKAWGIVADMKSLRSIHVDIRMGRLHTGRDWGVSRVQKWIEDRIFDPMRDVRQARVFDVVVNWHQSQDFVLGLVPFTLERMVNRPAWGDARDRTYV